MVRRAEVTDLLGILRGSVRGMRTALRLGVRWVADRLHYPRGTRLAMGNALVSNLFHRLLARDGPGLVHRDRDAPAHRRRPGRRRRGGLRRAPRRAGRCRRSRPGW